MIIKRLFDFTAAAVMIVILTPIYIVVGVLLFCFLGRPVLFKQLRPGQHGKPFSIYKFRTMGDERSDSGELLSDELRLTRFGRLLRASSIDELPELWNVIKGDMSLVGPRPLLLEYLPLYNDEQKRRMEVRPGITGWAQINGRNTLSWEDRFQYDVWYVDNRSFWLDLKILLLTIVRVIRADGISQDGHATMENFKGSK